MNVDDGAIEIKLPDLSRVALEPGDAILVRVSHGLLSMADSERIERRIKAKLPGHEVLVASGNIELAVIRPVKPSSAPVAEHRLLGRISGAAGITSFCSCGHSFYGRFVEEADRRFDAHRPELVTVARDNDPDDPRPQEV